MAVVHYKFKNSIEYDSITFDGLAISLSDLEKDIMTKKRMRPEDTDLRVINAQTGEVYASANVMIPKNTSLTVSRVPAASAHHRVEKITAQEKAQKWAAFRQETRAAIREAEGGEVGFNSEKTKKSSDLINAPMSEMDKIAQMIKQSTKDFHPSNYSYKVPTGTPGSSYVCFRCGKAGHYIQNCPNTPTDNSAPVSSDMRIKKPTGIPLEHMLIVSEALPGTYKTHTGHYAVPKIDAAAYATGKKEKPPFLPEMHKKMVVLKKPVPKELKCPLCGDLARDAVVIPCCGISYCDECIRNKLLETDDHVCPSCDSMDVSPDGLIANQMLRRAVTNFQNETGYTKIAAKAAAVHKAKEASFHSMTQARVVPKGPSVLDFRPPKEESPPPPPPPPRPKTSSAAPAMNSVLSVDMKPPLQSLEPPTPTIDEPQPSLIPPVGQTISSTVQIPIQGESLSTIVGMRTGIPVQPVQSVQQSDPYYNPLPPSSMAPTVPYPVPGYPPPTLPPPQFLPPPVPGVIPPTVPPVVCSVVPPAVNRPPVPIPPLNLPKPLSKHEFLQEKERLRREEIRTESDPLLEFQRALERMEKKPPRSRSKTRSRTRSRSKSRPRYRSRTRSRSKGRSFSRSPRRLSPRRSRSPRRSMSPRRSRSPRRSWSPRSPRRSRSRSPRRSISPRRSRSPYRRSRSPRRSFTPRRSWSPRRSRSPRFRRSFSRSPVRRRSFSRSPYRKRSFSRSPRRSPLRRSRSRGRFSPSRRSRSPVRRSRSRSHEFSRRRSYSFSPNRRRSPFRDNNSSRDRRSPVGRKKSPVKGNKDRSEKSPKREKSAGRSDSVTKNIPTIRTSNKDTSHKNKTADQNKENIPNRKGTLQSNLVVINVVDQEATTGTDVKDAGAKSEAKANTNQDEKLPSQETETKVEVVNKASDSENKEKVDDQNESKVNEKEIEHKLIETEKDKASDKSENKKEASSKRGDKDRDKNRERDKKTDNKSRPRDRRSRSRDRTSGPQRSNRPRRRRSPNKKKSPSDSPSPPRVKAPLILSDSYRDNYRDRGYGRGGRGRGGMRRDGRDQYMERDRVPGPVPGPEYRGGQEYMGGFGRGEPPYRPLEPDFRVPPPGHPEFRPGPPDFRGQPPFPPDPQAPPPLLDFHRRNSPGYPANFNFNYPPRDPREDPNFQGQIRDEDVVKFEQYKQMYDMYYNRNYGFPPGPAPLPAGQTPPQGPPPAPPGTAPIPPLLGPPSAYDRVSPPRRHRSRSPPKGLDSRRDRRDYDRDRGRDRPRVIDHRDRPYPERDDRSRRSPDRDHRNADRDRKSVDRDRRDRDRDRHSPDRRTEKSDKHNSKDKESSPERKTKESDDKVSKKDKKAKKKKDKDGGEKRKKKKKEKTKEKVRKEKAKEEDEESSADEEPVVKKKTKKKAETDSSASETDTTEKSKKRRTQSNATQSESSDHEAESRKQSVSEEGPSPNNEKPSAKIENEEQETVVSSSVTETVKQENESDKNASDEEKSQNNDNKRRRSIKRTKPDRSSGDEEVDIPEENVKKPKLEEGKGVVVESMDTSGEKSPSGSDLDEIPQPEDELMLDPPEVSKWEKEDDPYDLSPEPTKMKEKWKPEKPTLLPRSVIEKAEKAFSQKVMKPTTIASAVSLPRPKEELKKEVKSPEDIKKSEIQKKFVKSPPEPKRRVFMDNEKNKDERRTQLKQNSVKITVSSSKDDDRRKVSTGSGDLRDKISKRRDEEPRHKVRVDDKKGRQDSHKEKDRREIIKEHSRQDSRTVKESKTHKHSSRKESVVDESRFVPDYDDDESESDDNKYSEDSSSDSSSEEEVRKKKHKKNKHKKDKKRKKEKKEKKKKKHKDKGRDGK